MPIPSIRPSGTGPAMLSTERESSVGGIFLIETGSVSTFRISPGGQLPSNVKEQLTTVVARVYTSDVARPNTVVFELLREAPALNSAANEVIKFFSLRNQTIPQDQIVGIKFADKYSAGDGPSAALSCALLLDSLFTGAALDPKFAAIGDFNADGTVQPSFRIEERIIAAGGADCSHLAIPHQHLKALPDLLITQGTAPFLKAQVFTVEKFDDARALALAPEIRDPKIQESLKVFGEVQSALNRSGAGAHLAHADVVSRLQRVLELTPNHASALLLMMKATNREPAALTLSGSLKAVLRASENPDKGEGYFALLRDRKKLDRRVWAWADAVSHSLSLQRMGRPGRTEAYQQVQLEFQKLLNDPHIREALNQ